MKIRSFETENFAGITNKSIDFTEGINVIFGPNEAGKSTIIDGIYHAIFTPAKLHKSSDRDFYEKYFSPDSDTINASVEFERDNQRYRIEKQWSKSKDFSERLILADGSIVTDAKKINNIISEIFYFGPATYRVLNFSSQANAENTLINLDSSNVRNDVSDHINKSLMELDGISLEKLESGINYRINKLIGRWDVENLRPMNNRGIDNPYTNGVGSILASYYEKEELKRSIETAIEKEKAFEQASLRLKKAEENLSENKKAKVKLDSIAEDIRKRESLELKTKGLDSQLEDLKKAIVELPQLTSKKTNLENHGKSLSEQKTQLENKIKHIEKNKKLEELKEHIKAFDESKEKYLETEKELKAYENITERDLQQLQDANNKIYRFENQLKSDGLRGNLKILDESKAEDIEIVNGLGEKLTGDFKGSYLKLKLDEILEFSVEISGLDFEKINKELLEEKNKRDEVLRKTACKDEGDLRVKLSKKSDLEKLRDKLIFETKQVLRGRKYEDLIEEAKSLEDFKESYNEEEINESLKKVSSELEECKLDFIKVDMELKKLLEKYESNDKIFQMISDLSVEKNKLDENLSKLAELPESFESTDEFFKKKESLDRENQVYNEDYFEVNKVYNDCLRNLPQTSVEDMSLDYKEAKQKFEKLLENYENLSHIREVFYETKEELLDNPTAGIEDSISGYLDRITQGSIKIESLDDEIALSGKTSNNLKEVHLSKGSKDAVGLAFRLALIENTFANGSFIAFDDVLNDLDETRRQEAVEIIKEFSENNQVIFASCEPTIRDMLAGNLNEIGKVN